MICKSRANFINRTKKKVITIWLPPSNQNSFYASTKAENWGLYATKAL